jgi:hypothetical protein
MNSGTEITLRVDYYRSDAPTRGSLLVRRYQVEDNLGNVIGRALTRKLPKLINRDAEKYVLLLERDQWTLASRQILDEVDRQRAQFPLLDKVDELWIVDTVGYEKGGHAGFELREGRDLVAGFRFKNGALTRNFEFGFWHPTPQSPSE